MSCITITFSDCGKNHKDKQIIEKEAYYVYKKILGVKKMVNINIKKIHFKIIYIMFFFYQIHILLV